MKKWVSLVLVVMLMTVTALALAEDASVQAIQDKGVLVLGLDDSFPPMGYRNEAGEIVGFDIDVAKAVTARLGVELTLQPIDWGSKELELASGNIDCIWNGMSINADRQESMSMTFPYLNNQIVFYAMEDAGFATLEDLAGKRIGVQGGSYAEELLESADYADLKNSFAEVLSYDEYLMALMDLELGGSDAVLVDRIMAEVRITDMGSDNIVPLVVLENDNFGIGFRKADVALRDKVEEILVEMKKDGSLGEIATVWFGSDITCVPAE